MGFRKGNRSEFKKRNVRRLRMRWRKIAAVFFTRGSHREYKGHDASGRRGLMLALLATAPRAARRAFTERRYTGNAICPRRDVPLFFPSFFSFFLFAFFASFAASIYSSRRHLTPSWDRPHLARASTYKNFICLAYAILYRCLFITLFPADIRFVFYFCFFPHQRLCKYSH